MLRKINYTSQRCDFSHKYLHNSTKEKQAKIKENKSNKRENKNGNSFKKRYEKLIKSHMNHKTQSTNGLNLLIKDVKGYSQAQNAWRFYNNNNVDIESLNNPILEKGIESINKQCNKYVLVAHDWSIVSYRNHTSKKDCIQTTRSNSKNALSKGYDLQSSVGISDITGEIITLLINNLKTKDKVFSTYDNNINMDLTHLNELAHRIKHINNNMNISKKIVHIIDREADSVGFIRDLDDNDFYIIRALDRVLIEHQGNRIKQKELDIGEFVKNIKYKKKKVKIYVNSTDITIKRDSYKSLNKINVINISPKITQQIINMFP